MCNRRDACVNNWPRAHGSIPARRGLNRPQIAVLSFAQFRKYRSTISCQDQEPPAIDGVWPGHTVAVDCVAELSYPVSGSPTRPVITGSARTVGAFVFYRPQLEMRVTGLSVSRDEYSSAVSWQLQLEEV